MPWSEQNMDLAMETWQLTLQDRTSTVAVATLNPTPPMGGMATVYLVVQSAMELQTVETAQGSP